MRLTKNKLLIVLFITNLNASDKVIPIQTLENIGKSIISQASFYSTCGNKKIIKTIPNVARYTQFNGTRYIGLITSLFPNKKYPNIEKIWYKNGTKGIVITDPTASDDAITIEFNKKNCSFVKNLLEYKFNLMSKSIFQK